MGATFTAEAPTLKGSHGMTGRLGHEAPGGGRGS